MSTLQELKKQQGLTNASIGKALGCSASVAGMILQGRHIHVYHDEQIAQLAKVLGITFERCWYAMCESYNAWRGAPGVEHQRADELRYDALTELQERMPDVSIEIQQPRQLAMVDGYVAEAEQYIEEHRQDLEELCSQPKILPTINTLHERAVHEQMQQYHEHAIKYLEEDGTGT